jgi:hypothetical protein
MFFFDQLGLLVENLWKEQNYDERAFPKVACRAMKELPPDQHVTFWDAVQWGLTKNPLITQSDIDADFGQPPLTVFNGRDFRIEVLFWVHGIPGIHEHGFSGAFHVMHGSSIHTHWHFNIESRINTRLFLGTTRLETGEILHKGDIRPIVSGNEFIHTTFHLECPSVSVVVRTTTELDRQPQLGYEPPSVAYASQNSVPTIRRRAQILNMLYIGGQRKEYFEMLRHMLATADAYAAFYYLTQANGLIRDEETRQNVVLAAKITHPRLVAAITPTLAYSRRQEEIRKLRQKASSPEQRFVLAIVMNIPDLNIAIELLRQEYPGNDPVKMIVDCINDLSNRSLLGVTLNHSWLEVLTGLVSGLTEDEIEQQFILTYGSDRRGEFRRVIESVQEFWLLKPLFSRRREKSFQVVVQASA